MDVASDFPQQGKSLEMRNRCAEIKIRAERKAGEMLAEMEKRPAGRPLENRSHDVTDFKPPKLSELGIGLMDSSRWQSIASIPEDIFEGHVEDSRKAKEELTSAGALRLARTLKQEATHKELQNRENPTYTVAD